MTTTTDYATELAALHLQAAAHWDAAAEQANRNWDGPRVLACRARAAENRAAAAALNA